MSSRTYKQAAELAGCSINTLKRYECSWCGQSKLNQYRGICGDIYGRCDPNYLPKFRDIKTKEAPA